MLASAAPAVPCAQRWPGGARGRLGATGTTHLPIDTVHESINDVDSGERSTVFAMYKCKWLRLQLEDAVRRRGGYIVTALPTGHGPTGLAEMAEMAERPEGCRLARGCRAAKFRAAGLHFLHFVHLHFLHFVRRPVSPGIQCRFW